MVKEVKLMAQTRDIRIHQYLDDWLLRAPCPKTCLQHTQTLLALCHELGWVVNLKKSELTSICFQFRRLPLQPVDRSCLTHSGKVGYPSTETKVHQRPERLHSQTVHVPDRSAYNNRETGVVRSPSHKTHTVASEATLACTREFGKDHFFAQVSTPTSRLVVK